MTIRLSLLRAVVLDGAAPGAPSSLETNVIVAEILDAARRSAASGKSIRLAARLKLRMNLLHVGASVPLVQGAQSCALRDAFGRRRIVHSCTSGTLAPTLSSISLMHIVCAIAGILSILGILLDAFETVVLPRRVQRSFPPDQLVLPAHLDSVSRTRQPHSVTGAAGEFSRLLRAAVADLPADFVGGRADLWFRPAAIRSRRTLPSGRRASYFWPAGLPQRRDFFHPGLRGHHSQLRCGPRPGGDRSPAWASAF